MTDDNQQLTNTRNNGESKAYNPLWGREDTYYRPGTRQAAIDKLIDARKQALPHSSRHEACC